MNKRVFIVIHFITESKRQKIMSRLTFDQLLDAGVHFGHLTRKWNPAMAPYIFMEQNGIHIIDLHKTVAKIDEAAEALKDLASEGKTILFVGTKDQAHEAIEMAAKKTNMPYVTERWLGGMLTNFPTIRKTVSKMNNIDKMIEDGTFDNLSKRERLQVTRQRAKLEANFGSIADMKLLPQALFIVDTLREHIAIHEAQRLGIPVFAIVDTNANPKGLDYVIPANDDTRVGLELILGVLADAIVEGLQERKVRVSDKEEEDTDADQPRAGRRRERRAGARRRSSGEDVAEQSDDTPVAEDVKADEAETASEE